MHDNWVACFRTQSRQNIGRFLRKCTKVLRSIRLVRFTRAKQRLANIRESTGPSIGKVQLKVLHQRSLYSSNFEDRSQEEIDRQERCARGDAWRLAMNFLKLKEKDKSYFLTGQRMVSPSAIRNYWRDFVVDSGVSMHMLSRKGLNSAELEAARVPHSQRRGANKRRGNSVCQRIGFIRDSKASRRYTSRSLTRKTLWRPLLCPRVDQWSETKYHQKWPT